MVAARARGRRCEAGTPVMAVDSLLAAGLEAGLECMAVLAGARVVDFQVAVVGAGAAADPTEDTVNYVSLGARFELHGI
jgi:hypothetical protein